MKVSAIIPIYNSEKHLHQCIDSILHQDFDDFEILLINDGSTDNSREICERYAKDDRIKVYHQSNAGVSAARNFGLEKATGEWITFIDSDDTIQHNYFAALSKSKDADLIMLGFNYCRDGVKEKEHRYGEGVFSTGEFINKYPLYPYLSSSWAKFFKKKIVQEHAINFRVNIPFGEDSIFTLEYLLVCSRIITTDSSYYEYRLLDSGLSNSKLNLNHDKIFYETIKSVVNKIDNQQFRNEAMIIPLTRLINSLYTERKLDRRGRTILLKKSVEENYSIIFEIFSDIKIKGVVLYCHLTGSYYLLDFVLSKLIP